MLNVSETLKAEPLLNKDKLEGSGLYFEYRTDDSRLVIELAKSAFAAGALLLNYAAVTGFLQNEAGIVNGVVVNDEQTKNTFEIKGKVVVNACGPWVDLLRKEDQSLKGKRLQLTKGVHIVFPFEKLPLQQAAYFDVGDGRMIFAIPRNGITYVGTTDTVYNQDIDHPVCSAEDAAYLLNAVNHVFPTVDLKEQDIVSTWAGLRPLIQEDGKSPSELSRKDEIFVSASGLISIAGGKLTGYRLMSEKIVDLAEKKLNKKFSNCTTATHLLSGGEFKNDEDFEKSLAELIATTEGKISKEKIEEWFYRYGKNTAAIIDLFLKKPLSDKNEEVDLLRAELEYGLQHEMVTLTSDFFIRRTGKIFFDREQSLAQLPLVNDLLKAEFGWHETESLDSLAEVGSEFAEAVGFRA